MVLMNSSLSLDNDKIISKWFKKNMLKLIVIHGPSASGKTTLARILQETLDVNGIKTFSISLDSYYKTCPYTGDDLKKYDFDNPAALDWEKLYITLKAIENNEPLIPTFFYSFMQRKSKGPFFVKNPLINISNDKRIVFLEGIYVMNMVSEYSFDLPKYNPLIQLPEALFVPSEYKLKKFSILKIRLSLCKDLLFSIRKKRDVLERGKALEMVEYQFYNQVWPATKKYVNSKVFQEDILITHGTFNRKKFEELFRLITKEFHVENVPFNAPEDKNMSLSCDEKCELE